MLNPIIIAQHYDGSGGSKFTNMLNAIGDQDYPTLSQVKALILSNSTGKPAVISIANNTAPPPTEVDGDRYILDSTGASNPSWDGASANDIVQFNGTSGLWEADTPDEGWSTYVDDVNSIAIFQDDPLVGWVIHPLTPTLASVLVAGNTSGGNNLQMTGTHQTQYGSTSDYIQSDGSGNLKYTSAGSHKLYTVDGLVDIGTLGASVFEKVSTGEKIQFNPGAGVIGRVDGAVVVAIDLKSLPTASRTLQAPDKSGIIAVTSDIVPAQSLSDVLTIGNTSGANDISMAASQKVFFGAATNWITGSANDITSETLRGYGFKGANYELTWGNSAMQYVDNATPTSSLTLSTAATGGGISHNKAGGISSLIDMSGTTASRTWTMPDATGTVALTSDIPTNHVTTDTNQTITGDKNWDGINVFNEPGADKDLRIESTSNPYMFFLDAGTNKIGINEANPDTTLHITDLTQSHGIAIEKDDTKSAFYCIKSSGVDAYKTTVTSTGLVAIRNYTEDADITIQVNDGGANTSLMYFDGSTSRVGILTSGPSATLDVRGSVTFNEDGGNNNFRVEGTSNANLLVTQASTNRVGIGTDTPSHLLHVAGTIHSNAVTSTDNLRLIKSTSSTSWFINAGRTGFFDNWLLFKNSAEAGNYTFAISNDGAFRAKNGSAGAPAYTFDLGSNYGMSLNATNDGLVLSAAGFPLVTLEGGATKRTKIRFDTMFCHGGISTVTRDGLTVQNGDFIYNTTVNKFQGYAGGVWVDLH